MTAGGAPEPTAALFAPAEISNLLNVILGSSGATMRELASGAAAVESGMERTMPSWNRGHIVGQKPPLKP
jgi:hypothetical protein